MKRRRRRRRRKRREEKRVSFRSKKGFSPLMKVASIDNSSRGNFIAKLLIRDIH